MRSTKLENPRTKAKTIIRPPFTSRNKPHQKAGFASCKASRSTRVLREASDGRWTSGARRGIRRPSVHGAYGVCWTTTGMQPLCIPWLSSPSSDLLASLLYPGFGFAHSVRFIVVATIGSNRRLNTSVPKNFTESQIVVWVVIQPTVGEGIPKKVRRDPASAITGRKVPHQTSYAS